jgi:hypothetical protein
MWLEQLSCWPRQLTQWQSLILRQVALRGCTVGWIDFHFFRIWVKVKWRSIVSLVKVRKITQNVFCSVNLIAECLIFWVTHYVRVKRMFSQWWLIGYQKAENFFSLIVFVRPDILFLHLFSSATTLRTTYSETLSQIVAHRRTGSPL